MVVYLIMYIPTSLAIMSFLYTLKMSIVIWLLCDLKQILKFKTETLPSSEIYSHQVCLKQGDIFFIK